MNPLLETGSAICLISTLLKNLFLLQTAAALAIHAISSSNPVTQEAIREVGGVEPLKKLMKNRSVDVKVYAATAVWAVAGDQLVARQLVASQVRYSHRYVEGTKF